MAAPEKGSYLQERTIYGAMSLNASLTLTSLHHKSCGMPLNARILVHGRLGMFPKNPNLQVIELGELGTRRFRHHAVAR